MSRGAWRTAIIIVLVLVAGLVIGLSLTGQLRTQQPRPTGPALARPPGQPEQPQPQAGATKPLGLTLRGQVQAAQNRAVAAPVAAEVVALVAPEGQPVVEGQLLMQLDVPQVRQQLVAAQARLARLKALQEKARDPEVRDRLRAAEMAVQDAEGKAKQMQADLNDYIQQNPEVVTIEDTYARAKADADAAQAVYTAAQREFDQAQQISGRTGKPPANFMALQGKFQEAQARQRQAQTLFDQAREARSRLRNEITRLDLLRKRVTGGLRMARQLAERLQHLRQTPEAAMVAQGDQQVRQAAEAVQRLEAQTSQLAVKAPVTGRLSEIKVRPGQQVKAGQALAVVRDTGGSRLVFPTGPKEAARLTVGLRGTVEVSGGTTFAAAVSQIAPGKDAAQVYLVPLRQMALPAPGTPLVAKL